MNTSNFAAELYFNVMVDKDIDLFKISKAPFLKSELGLSFFTSGIGNF